MRAIEFIREIDNLKFFGSPGLFFILESYTNPEHELTIDFDLRFVEYGSSYYQAVVKEKESGKIRVVIDFKLDENGHDLDVGNIVSFADSGEEKMVHTSQGNYLGGLDLGHSGVKWMFRKVKEFAQSKGFDVKKITSSTRFTGARAKNNPGEDNLGLPNHFNVGKKIREVVVYESSNNTTTLYYLED